VGLHLLHCYRLTTTNSDIGKSFPMVAIDSFLLCVNITVLSIVIAWKTFTFTLVVNHGTAV